MQYLKIKPVVEKDTADSETPSGNNCSNWSGVGLLG